MITQTYRTFAETVWHSEKTLTRNILLSVIGCMALIISAKIQVPFYPVPMTMQTMAVLMIGMAFGWRLGGATVLFYLAQGAAGLPVFAGTPEKGIGLAYLAGPTGGYLVGFAVAAALVGWLAERGWDRSIVKAAFAIFLGTLTIYAFGLLWLGSLIGWDKPVLQLGATPFLLGEATKLVLAALLMPFLWKLLRRFQP